MILLSIALMALIVLGIGRIGGNSSSLASQPQIVELELHGRLAASIPATDIFTVNGTTGNDGGLASLIKLMGTQGRPFYKSSVSGESQGPTGLVARDDTLIIKVNGQWDERGGTNTDLLRS
jgi:hypothetical protein